MAKEAIRNTRDQIVNEYLNKRFRTKSIEEQDPLRMVVSDMIDRMIRE